MAQAAGPALSPGRAGEGLQGFTWSTGDGLCPGSQNPPPPLMSVPFPAVPSDHSLALTLALIRQGLDGPQILRQNVVILLESRPPLPLFYLKQQMREDVVRGKLTVDIFKWTRSSRKRRAVQKAPPSLWTDRRSRGSRDGPWPRRRGWRQAGSSVSGGGRVCVTKLPFLSTDSLTVALIVSRENGC